ncbi:MAG TPA: ABC transporter ATP-binding protein, partial [Alphaproteobacteria bacterium]|nr:ABC transporter ATP-binding protein [Alphaproteobacteria bacterium]
NLRELVSEQGISVLVVEHNMDFILRAGVDRIVVMDRGKFLMEGTPNEVRQSRDVVEAYLGDPEGESA